MIARSRFVPSHACRFDQALDAFVDQLATDTKADPSWLIQRFPHRAAEIRQTIRVAKRATSWIDQDTTPPLRGVLKHTVPQQIGRFRIMATLGIGGMGVVYKAIHRSGTSVPNRQGEACAIKVIHPELKRPHFIESFRYEQECSNRLSHPGIAGGIEAGITSEGHHFLAMELIQGGDLVSHCLGQRSSLRERLKLFASVCDTVAFIHDHGVLHRDLKPANILVSGNSGLAVPKIIDFGLAKPIDSVATCSTARRWTIELLGTLEYMSPEQAAQQSCQLDKRSDIFSLGAILFELLTGTTPLEPKRDCELAITERLARVRRQERPAPSTRLQELRGGDRSAIPAELDTLCHAALALRPEDRPSSAHELAKQIRSLETKI